MFFKILRYDIRNGLLHEYKKILITIGLSLIFCFDFLYHRRAMMPSDGSSVSTYADVTFFILAGMQRYKWLLIMALIFYFILYYPYHDLEGYGKQILVNSLSRIQWWFSKCCWLILSVLSYFLIIWIVIALFSLVSHFPLTLHVSKYVFDYIYSYQNSLLINYPDTLNIQLFLLPVLVVISIGLFQMLLSMLIKPLFSFVLTVGIMFASHCSIQPYLIGNYAMAVRSNRLIGNGVSAQAGILLSLLISFLSIAGGAFVFRRYDILGKGD